MQPKEWIVKGHIEFEGETVACSLKFREFGEGGRYQAHWRGEGAFPSCKYSHYQKARFIADRDDLELNANGVGDVLGLCFVLDRARIEGQ